MVAEVVHGAPYRFREAASPALDGRSVFGWERDLAKVNRS
jgi:hypothetical protein